LPEENVSLPRGYRSCGTRWLALTADVLIATTLSAVLAFSISWLARRRALKKPEINSAEQRSEES